MSPLDLARVAGSALVRARLRAGLSLLGIAIGVAAVVVLTALGEGARRYIRQQFEFLGADLVIVVPGRNETTGAFPGFGGVPNDLTLEDARAVERQVRGVRLLAPVSMGNETISAGQRSRQAIVLGTTPAMQDVRELVMARGSFLPDLELDRSAPVVVLGAKLAEELFGAEEPVGQPVRIGDWRMRVMGVIESRGMQVGFDMDEVAFVPVAAGMRIFNRSSLFRLLIKLQPGADADRVERDVLALLTERHDEEDVTVLTPESVASALGSILVALTAALAAIAAISLAVAGIGIMNVMLVSVTERTSEIGLLKAIGAGRRQVMSIFLAEAVILCATGGALGLLIAWGAVRVLVALYPTFPAAPPAWAAPAAMGVSIVVGAVFGVLPARRAMKLDPVVALASR